MMFVTHINISLMLNYVH